MALSYIQNLLKMFDIQKNLIPQTNSHGAILKKKQLAFSFFSVEDEFYLWIPWNCPTFLPQPRERKLEPHILPKFHLIAEVWPWDDFDLWFFHFRVLSANSPCTPNCTNPKIYGYFGNVRNLLLSPTFLTYFFNFFFFWETSVHHLFSISSFQHLNKGNPEAQILIT